MSNNFVSSAFALSSNGFYEALDSIKIGAAELLAVIAVETSGCGFIKSKKPKILFERHIFSRQTNGIFDADYPSISNPNAGGYGEHGGEYQYQRLEEAIKLNKTAALNSASWGLGQIMGFNSKIAGFSNVEEMVNSFLLSEDNQLLGMCNFLNNSGLIKPLRVRDWKGFAKGYNGKAYAKNNYDGRLLSAYEKFKSGAIPDVDVRAGQLYLTYLNFYPGSIDGVMGKFTVSALHEFQKEKGREFTDYIQEKEVLELKQYI